ncbi:peptide deformylase [Thermoleophilia bacterium SCSIO 60948]|nr:peptide deformylase [Thermoleophilia bacterium SCSIO 60948]
MAAADHPRENEELEGEPDTEVAQEHAGELDDEARRRRSEAFAQIVTFGNPALKSRASAVTEFGPELAAEGERMIGLMHDAVGVGLAAPQLGILRRMLVFQSGPDARPEALVNPEFEWLSDETELGLEGCLSLPRIAVDVERSLHAVVRAQDVSGEPLLIEASGFEARVLQHEIDHINGVLMLDRSPRSQRRAALRALREGVAYHPDPEVESELEEPEREPA